MSSQLKLVTVLVACIAVGACGKPKYVASDPAAETAALNKPNPEGLYGEGVKAKESVSVAALLENPAPYVGKQVAVRGTVSDVCAMRGCWMDVTDDSGKEIRIKVTDGQIIFPVSAKGHRVQAEGVLEKLELTADQAREAKEHEAMEKGETAETSNVQGPTTVWRIRGTGARIEGEAPSAR